MKEPHTALFVAPTGVGKTHLALNLLESEYKNRFNFVVIICSTLAHNETYKSRGWVWNDPDVILIEAGNHLYDWIKVVGNELAGSNTLFIVDEINANEALDKRCQPLLGLAISGRHRKHLLWLLMQSYIGVPLNIRRQAKMLYVWHQKKQGDWDAIHEENDVIKTPEEIANVKEQLRQGKCTCLIMRMEQPMAYEIR